MSSRFPMGVPTKYRHASSRADRSALTVLELFTLMEKSLARAADTRGPLRVRPRAVNLMEWPQSGQFASASNAIILVLKPWRRIVRAPVRVQMPAMRPAHGENREGHRTAPKKVSALRQPGRIADLRSGHPIQRLGLVRDRLRRK